MEFFKIVLTGGPCAGKTTILNAIKKDLEEKGIPCYIVSEAATELITSGIKPWEWEPYEFQTFVLKRNMLKEEEVASYMAKHANDEGKCVIIYDRAIFDNMAYLDSVDDFTRLLCSNNLNVMKTLDSYDLILDLLSVATCKPEAYNFGNVARSESVDVARKLDQKTANAWAGHRNMKVISSDVTMAEEIDMVLKIVHDFIDGKDKNKIKSFLVDQERSDLSVYDNYFNIYVHSSYLDFDNEDYIYKLSERYCKGTSYIFEVYKHVGDAQVKLMSYNIDKDLYNELYWGRKHLREERTREIGLVYDKCLCNLVFHDGKVTIDVYNNTNDEIKLPSNIKVIEEIKNNELAITNKDRANVECIKKMLKK